MAGAKADWPGWRIKEVEEGEDRENTRLEMTEIEVEEWRDTKEELNLIFCTARHMEY